VPGKGGDFTVEAVQHVDVAGGVRTLRTGDVGVKHQGVDVFVDAVVAIVADILVVLVGVHRVDADSGDGAAGIVGADDVTLHLDDVHDVFHGAVKVFTDHRLVLRLPDIDEAATGDDLAGQLLLLHRQLLGGERNHLLEGVEDVHAADDLDRLAGGDLFGCGRNALVIRLLEPGEEQLAIPLRTAEAAHFGGEPTPDAEGGFRRFVVVRRERRGDQERGFCGFGGLAVADDFGADLIVIRPGQLDGEALRALFAVLREKHTVERIGGGHPE